MASIEFASGSDQAVSRWSTSLARETLGKTYFKRFAGTSQSSIIRVHTDLVRGAGDVIKYDLRVQDRTDGRHGDQELRGFESPLTFYQEELKIGQLRKAHEFRGESQQRTVHDLRREARDSLSTWWAWVFDSLMFAYLSGYVGTVAENPECCLPVYGTSGFAGNTVTAPDAAHKYDPSATMLLAHIDALIEKAKTINPRVEPTMVGGKPYYALVLHPYSMRALIQQSGGFRTVLQEVGPRDASNPLFTGSPGIYRGVVMHESEFIPRASVQTYNVFLGANAGTFALGNAWGAGTSKPGMFKWVEETADYGNMKGVGSTCIFGINGNVFNSKRHGSITYISDDVVAT
jgi:N4-gp56 family major capsid protein